MLGYPLAETAASGSEEFAAVKEDAFREVVDAVLAAHDSGALAEAVAGGPDGFKARLELIVLDLFSALCARLSPRPPLQPSPPWLAACSSAARASKSSAGDAPAHAQQRALTPLPNPKPRSLQKHTNPKNQRQAFVNSIGKPQKRKGKRLFMPLRVALTGTMHGPDIGEQLALLAAADGSIADASAVVPLPARMEALRAWAAANL